MTRKLTVLVHCRRPCACVPRLSQEYQGIELCAKLLFQTELIRTRRDQEFGFTVEAKVADSSFQSDELCVFVSDVAKGGPVAQKKGTGNLFHLSISLKPASQLRFDYDTTTTKN